MFVAGGNIQISNEELKPCIVSIGQQGATPVTAKKSNCSEVNEKITLLLNLFITLASIVNITYSLSFVILSTACCSVNDAPT